MVFDLGGGTFNMTVLGVLIGVVEVKATHSNNHLGDNWDQEVLTWIAEHAGGSRAPTYAPTVRPCNASRSRRRRAKIELSTVIETEINLPFITADAYRPKHL
jgi:molecular chaperone DnaK